MCGAEESFEVQDPFRLIMINVEAKNYSGSQVVTAQLEMVSAASFSYIQYKKYCGGKKKGKQQYGINLIPISELVILENGI